MTLTADLGQAARYVVVAHDYVSTHRPGPSGLWDVSATKVRLWCDLFPTLSDADALALAREYADGRPALFTEQPA